MEIRRLANIKLPLGESEEELRKIARRALKCNPAYFRIVKKSLDARDKGNIFYVYTIEFAAKELSSAQIEPAVERLPKEKQPDKNKPVLIVGAGPAGLFCALRLLKRGIAPLLIERGESVERREKTLRTFHETGVLNTESNVSFGEGGAGTFSDGKLNTGTHVKENDEVLREFIRFGAPEEIAYLNKPHIGSDKLKTVVKNMREYLLANGACVLFNARLTNLKIENGKIAQAEITYRENDSSRTETIDVSALVLAVGHSARDTFEMLQKRGVPMEPKPFAVGVRIEHRQRDMDLAQYKEAAGTPGLPPTSYKLSCHTEKGRGVFSFCVCPGGEVVAAASEEKRVVTNGMSEFARDGENINGGLLVSVTPEDFPSGDTLAGVQFQRELEDAAYRLGGGNYAAPAQRVEDFLKHRPSTGAGKVVPTYLPSVRWCDLHGCLPPFVCEALEEGLPMLGRKLRGFDAPDAVLTAVETRSSSPVRIVRDNTYQTALRGLYPCGEGAGYAGGIMSAAADGLRVAEMILEELSHE